MSQRRVARSVIDTRMPSVRAENQKNVLFSCLKSTLHDSEMGASPPDMLPVSWQGMESLAEYHSVAPLLLRVIQRHHIDIPGRLRRQLQALVLRHRRANKIRFHCLGEISDVLASHDIDLIVLKGAALAHLIYRDTYLRPMRDLDLLLPVDKVDQAAYLLQERGFVMPRGLHRYNHRPHHLPILEKIVDGLHLSVELHHDVMPRDFRLSMTMADIEETPQSFVCAGRKLQAFNHTDMLRHLCVHSFSPSRELRLIHLYDIMAYATQFASQIDWHRLRMKYPYVINGIRCIHFLLPCPEVVAREVDPPKCPVPPGCGEAMQPLSSILGRGRTCAEIWQELFCPSPWWKYAYYGISPEKSLLYCHLLIHPAQVFRWLALRALSAVHATVRV